jgi:membrane protease YdiL (CAAX protease family)
MVPDARVSWTRIVRTVGFVAVWMTIGFAMRASRISWLDTNAYLVVGVPLTALWQVLVRRRSLLALWVEGAPRLPRRRVALGVGIGVVASVFPSIKLVQSVHEHAPSAAAWSACAIVGAFGLGYAAVAMRRKDVRPLLGSFATSGAIGVAIMVLALVAQVLVQHKATPEPRHALMVGLRSFALYFPVCFTLEEVSFRGLLDADVNDGRRLEGTLTAIMSTWLWGLWHLPTLPATISLPGAILSVTIVHLIVGVPLVLWYRRSGNLLVPAITHAFIDAMRNALVGGHG